MSASLAANQICRVIFAIVSILVSIVPLCILTRLGEFAAAVFVGNVILINIFTVINASIWRNDDLDSWWDGVGYCDLQTYVQLPMQCIYAACIFAIMRNLAQRLRLKRATELTLKERRRQMIHQALIIFPIPIIELALTWFILANRYVVGSVVGCFGLFGDNWFTTVVMNFPMAIFPLATVPFAYLTWKRFRDISKTTQEALAGNTEAAQRAQRTRRRLYGMALSIMVPYVPLQMAFIINNIITTFRNYEPYNFNLAHYGLDPYPWKGIMFLPSYLLPFQVLNQPWIGILTAIPIVLFFGKNQEAKSMYHSFFVHIGLVKATPTSTNKAKELATRNTEATHNETIQSVNLREHPITTRQIVMSSSGPFIPPRRSFHSQAGPDIPPRGSSLRSWARTPFRRIASSVGLPSGLSTLFSTCGSTSNVSAVSGPGTVGGGVGSAAVTPLPLSAVGGGGGGVGHFPFPEPLGPSARASGEASSSQRSPPSSIWNYLSAHHHTERGRPAAAEESDDAVENVGNGFVRVRVRSVNQ